MKTLPALVLILVLASGADAASPPFEVTLPKGFSGPETAVQGTTRVFAYTRPSGDAGLKTLFQVTFVQVPPEGRNNGLESMLAGMLRGVERRRSDFKVSEPAKTKLGNLEAVAAVWQGSAEGHAMKGRMICALSDRQLICVHYQDSARVWEKIEAELAKAVGTFALSK